MRSLNTSELDQVTGGALCVWPVGQCTDDEKMYTGKYLHLLSLGIAVGLAIGVVISPVGYQFYSALTGMIVGGVLTPSLLMPSLDVN